MRLLLCLNRDIFSNMALNLLLPTLRGHEVRILLSEGVGKPSSHAVLDELRLLERELINRVIFPLLDTRPYAAQHSHYLSFQQIHQQYGFLVESWKNINSVESVAALKDWAPDVIISIRYGQIFKEAVIALPRYGILNLHSGLLPDYRGILGTLQALRRGEKQIGCTLHYITDPGIDTGDVIGRHTLATDPHKPLMWHIAALYDGGVPMIINAIQSLAHSIRPGGTPQDPHAGTYYSSPTAEQLQEFVQQGYRVSTPETYCDLLARWGAVA